MPYYGTVRPESLLMIRVCVLTVALGGCAAEVSFDSPDSAARLRAIQRAAAQNDRSSIPKLIQMLDSDDPAVRLTSIRTLESWTGQTFGYDYAAQSFERAEAVDKWQAWYEARKGPAGSGVQPSERSVEQTPNGDGSGGGGAGTSEEAGASLRSKEGAGAGLKNTPGRGRGTMEGVA